jgi:hypothetical protein
MSQDLSLLVPISKFDTNLAERLVALGFPVVEPVLPQILEWVQDMNWPVSRVFQPFLVSIGSPLVPYVRAVLATHDDSWKHYVLIGIVSASPELARELRQDLDRLVQFPTHGEMTEEVSDVAAAVLHSLERAPNA